MTHNSEKQTAPSCKFSPQHYSALQWTKTYSSLN